MIDPTFAHALPPEPDARTVAILDRLTAAHGVIAGLVIWHERGRYSVLRRERRAAVGRRFDEVLIDGFAFDEANPDDADEVLREIAHEQGQCDELFATLATLAALLSDAGSEIARLNAENAGLRARSGK